MLPERRRRLIITIIGIILFVALAISLYAISNYVKSQNVPEEDIDNRPNSNYPSEYIIYGLTIDNDNIVRLYGLTDSYIEKYLGVRSFYKDQDNVIKDSHLFIYLDCVNELRFDERNKEFYLYKYDEYYSNNVKIKLSRNYIVLFDKNNKVTARKYNEEELKDVADGISYDNAFIKGDTIYYTDINGLHRYNLNNDVLTTLVDYKEYTIKPTLKILDINNNYIVYTKDGVLNIYSNQTNYSKDIATIAQLAGMGSSNIEYLELTNDGFYFQVANEDKTFSIKKFSLINSRLEEQSFVTKYRIINMETITKDLYYMNIIIDDKEDHIIFSTKVKDIVKNLENKYIYVTALEDSNEN